MSQDDKTYKEIALLNALIFSHSNCKPEIFGKLVAEYDEIIDYVIPSTSVFKLDKPSYRAGNTILHVAKELCQWDVCENFIHIGADITTKDNNGSPLLALESAASEYDRHFELKEGKKYSGMKFIEMVLGAHIEFEITDNPSDKNGISHFHFACMFNKVDLIELFLLNGISVNESVNADSPIYPGYTPLHFAAKYCAVEAVELLLKYNADIYVKDAKGLNPLHVLIEEKLNTWAQISRRQLADKDDKDNSPKFKSFHLKIERIINLLVGKNTFSGFRPYDDTGLSYFHVICTMQNTLLVTEFLDKCTGNLDQAVHANSALWPGYTALHFAAHFNADTVRLLVQKGANLAAKDAKGITPFDICLNGMMVSDIHSILKLDPTLCNIKFSDGKTMLSDFILALQDNRIFEAFLTKNSVDINTFIPYDSPICAGQTPLHLNVICNQILRNWKAENVDYYCFSSRDYLQHRLRVMTCVSRKANIYAQDARGLTPIHLAFHLQESYMAVEFLEFHDMFPEYSISNIVDEHGFSLLHIAAAASSQGVKAIQKLVSSGLDVNEVTKMNYNWYMVNSASSKKKTVYKTIGKGSTPLHIAVIVENSWIIKFLLDHNADVLAKDSDGLTPLERCFGTSIFENSDDIVWDIRGKPVSGNRKLILLSLIPSMSDVLADTRPDRMLYYYSLLNDEILKELLNIDNESIMKILKSAGITKLHVACFTKNLEEIDQQLENGIDVNTQVDSTSPLWRGFTPLHIFMNGYGWADDKKPEHVEIAKLLLDNGADVSAKDLIGNTPLHQMLQCYLDRGSNALFVDMMLGYTVDFSINPVNPKGLTHLHAACVRDNGPIVEKYLEHGVNVDQAVDYFDSKFGGYTALHFAAAYQSRKTADILFKNGTDVHLKNVMKENALHAAVARERHRPRIALLKNLISSFGVEMSDRDVFGERPLEKLMKSSDCTVQGVKVFIEKGCCVNVWNPITDEGCLSVALKNNDSCPIFETIIKASDIKSISPEGRNAIHNVVSYDIDWGEYEDEDPPLESFISKNNYTVAIETLINLGVDIDHQDERGCTPLHIAAHRQDITAIIGLLNNGANINIVDSSGKMAFQLCLQLSIQENRICLMILPFILSHLYKLKFIGVELSPACLEIYDETKILMLPGPILDHIVQECQSEFENMKSRKIGDYSITLNDFWSDTGVVSSYPYMLPDKRNAIDEYFKANSDNLKKYFPELVYLLLTQYKKAKARLDMIGCAEVSFNFLVGFHMPPICSRIIFGYLNNDDLKTLIKTIDTE